MITMSLRMVDGVSRGEGSVGIFEHDMVTWCELGWYVMVCHVCRDHFIILQS